MRLHRLITRATVAFPGVVVVLKLIHPLLHPFEGGALDPILRSLP